MASRLPAAVLLLLLLGVVVEGVPDKDEKVVALSLCKRFTHVVAVVVLLIVVLADEEVLEVLWWFDSSGVVCLLFDLKKMESYWDVGEVLVVWFRVVTMENHDLIEEM